MNKLSKSHEQVREQHLAAIGQARTGLGMAIDEYNAAKTAAWENVQAAIDNYNAIMGTNWAEIQSALDAMRAAIADADAFRAEVADQMQGYYDERSEKWQEGEKGEAYQGWIDTWSEELPELEDADQPEDLMVDEPDDLDQVDMDEAYDILEGLATSPDEA